MLKLNKLFYGSVLILVKYNNTGLLTVSCKNRCLVKIQPIMVKILVRPTSSWQRTYFIFMYLAFSTFIQSNFIQTFFFLSSFSFFNSFIPWESNPWAWRCCLRYRNLAAWCVYFERFFPKLTVHCAKTPLKADFVYSVHSECQIIVDGVEIRDCSSVYWIVNNQSLMVPYKNVKCLGPVWVSQCLL